jgi:hypothetical protein
VCIAKRQQPLIEHVAIGKVHIAEQSPVLVVALNVELNVNG